MINRIGKNEVSHKRFWQVQGNTLMQYLIQNSRVFPNRKTHGRVTPRQRGGNHRVHIFYRAGKTILYWVSFQYNAHGFVYTQRMGPTSGYI